MPPKVEFTFDPFSRTKQDIPESAKEDALNFIADLIKEQVLRKVGGYESPVDGAKWPNYNKEYADEKNVDVNEVSLELSGDMLDALQAEVKGDKIRIFIEGDQAGKAEGNNIGSYGNKPNPKKARRFIPLKGETWTEDIWKEIDDAIFGFSTEGEFNGE